MKYKESVKFNENLFFGGSLELDCLYNNRKLAQKAADSFIFHSKESYISEKKGKTDTISLVEILSKKIFSEKQSNPFYTAIAGYGAGKSHFGVALSSLLSNNNKFLDSNKVKENIKEIDEKVYNFIDNIIDKPNIVIAINGIDKFNLSNRLFERIKEYLDIVEVENNLFESHREIYQKAKIFVKNNFKNENFQETFKEIKNSEDFSNLEINKSDTKKFILNNIEDDKIFNLINEVSYRLNGIKFKKENFLNPKDIIQEVSSKFCGKNKTFGKLIIIFDELGHYIEWIGKKHDEDPAALQQLYEGIKNSKGKASLVSFIQFPIARYIDNLEPRTANKLSRFIGRFKSARQFYLSTELEPVFANLISIKDKNIFKNHSDLQEKILNWDTKLKNSNIWSKKEYYNNLICKDLAPFHPITIDLLSSISEYTQDRTPLAILRELLKKVSNDEVSELKSIWPNFVFNTSFVDDILNMEKDGRVKSDNVTTYERLVSKAKIKENLEAKDKAFLKGLLVINLLELNVGSKEDYYFLMKQLTGKGKEVIKNIINKLEKELGVIQYDDDKNHHHIVLDYVGRKDYERFITTKKYNIKHNFDIEGPEYFQNNLNVIANDLKLLTEINALKRYDIRTDEWQFPQTIIYSKSNLYNELNSIYKNIISAKKPSEPKGYIIWIYFDCTEEEYERVIDNVLEKYKEHELIKVPMITGFLLDHESQLKDAIIEKKAAYSLTETEQERYSSFNSEHKSKINSRIKQIFISLQNNSSIISLDHKNDNNLITMKGNYKKITHNRTSKVYDLLVPFKFDQFDNNRHFKNRKELIKIIKSFSNDKMNLSNLKDYLDTNTYNRMMGLLGEHGWDIFTDGKINEPKNKAVKKVYKAVKDQIVDIDEDDKFLIKNTYESLFKPPYGLNTYSAFMMIVYTLYLNKNKVILFYKDKKLTFEDWLFSVITEKDKLDVNKINYTKIGYRNIEKSKDLIKEMFNNIRNTKSANKIIEYEKEIEKRVNKDIVEKDFIKEYKDLQFRFHNAKEVNRITEEISDDLKKINNMIEYRDNRTLENVPNILKLYYKIFKNSDKLEDLNSKYEFRCDKEWLNNFITIKEKSIDYLKKYFGPWFYKNDYPSNNNVKGYINFCKEKLIKPLDRLGLTNFSKKVNKNIHKINRQIHQIENTYNKIAELNKIDAPDNLNKCKDLIERIDNEIEKVKKIENLNKNLENYFCNEFSDIKERFSTKKNKITKLLSNFYNDLSDKEFESIDELRSLINNIKNLKKFLSSSHPDYSILEETYSNGVNIINSVNSILKSDYTNKENVKSEIKELKEKYNLNCIDDPDYINSKNIFNNIEKELLNRIDKKQKKWMSNIPSKNLENLDKEKLNQIRNYISDPPIYLNDKNLEKIKKIKNKINDKLDSDLKSSIIRMFKEINDQDEQKSVIKKLNQLIM
ncbi:MAG: hypothetical protein K9K32_00510 [Halanaerobiales bacterium]|nr:hypothetical protein [Halanaerobiales bacterium]MCF8008219.1 hypothetical protein [Halanaerobiales bacterium]